MKIKVVGLEKNVTVTFDGKEYHGRRLHYSYTLPSGEGVGCNRQFLNDAKFANVPINVGSIYSADMNYGKIQYLEELDGKPNVES